MKKSYSKLRLRKALVSSILVLSIFSILQIGGVLPARAGTLIQTVNNQGVTNSLTLSVTLAHAGDIYIVAAESALTNPIVSVATVSDTLGNVWTLQKSAFNDNACGLAGISCWAGAFTATVAGTGADTITVSYNATAVVDATVQDTFGWTLTGISIASATTNSCATPCTTAVAPTFTLTNGEFVEGVIAASATSAISTISAGAGFTLDGQKTIGNSVMGNEHSFTVTGTTTVPFVITTTANPVWYVEVAIGLINTQPTLQNAADCGVNSGASGNANIVCKVPVQFTGDALYMTCSCFNEAGTSSIVIAVVDNQTNTWSKIVSNTGCGGGNCYDTEIWSTKASGHGHASVTITVDNTHGYPTTQDTIFLFDVAGASPIPVGTSSAYCNPCTIAGGVFGGTPPVSFIPGQTFLLSTIIPPVAFCTGGVNCIQATAGFTLFYHLSNFGGGQYGSRVNSPTTFSYCYYTGTGCGTFSGSYSLVGAVFGPSSPGLFTCSILNMDAVNYLVAGVQKYYQFFCEVQSSAISATMNDPISDVKVRFNDSFVSPTSAGLSNIVVMEYNNDTKQWSLNQGGDIASLGSPGTPTIVQSYNPANAVRSMNITFLMSLSGGAISTNNRGIELYAALNNSQSKGFTYVRTNYFNIILQGSGGGALSKSLVSGLCALLPGADAFSTKCAYGANPHNWIATNATYYQLQHYQGQFALATYDHFDGNADPFFWQNYANSGGGANPSSNKGDWKIDAGFYYFDNTSSTCCWVKGIHLTLQTLVGRVGSSNLWTMFDALWYNGPTLVRNDTFTAFVPNDLVGNGDQGQSQVNIWLNFWYSQNNGSTYQGGEVGAYYTGMHNTGYLIWSSWSPFLYNYTESQVFVPILDHSGKLMSASQAQFTKVYMNMTRPGAPAVNPGQINFDIATNHFQQQEFNTASGGIMTGMATPTFAVAVVPTIQSNSIFSPIINALKALAGWISKALYSLGTVIWSALANQFPWFTNFWTGVGSAVVSFATLFADVIINLVKFLQFLVSSFATLFNPILSILTSAWNIIGTLTGWLKYLPTASIAPTIEVFILIVFGVSIVEALLTGDWPYVIKITKGGWAVVSTIMEWTWRLVKFLIDTIEGLIP